MKSAIRKTKWFSPYQPGGKKTNLTGFKCPGVYMIKKGKEIFYVGYSASNLYKALTRHFQSWLDNSQVRAVYSTTDQDIKVRVAKTSAAKAHVLEMLLILKHQPKDCTVKYERYTAKSEDKKIIKEYEAAPEESIW